MEGADLGGLSREELLEVTRRQQAELAEREAAIERRDEKIRELEEELAQFRRPVKIREIFTSGGCPMIATTGIDAWIRELRAQLERGDLADLGPVDLGYGTEILAGELTVRIMLVDLDDLEAQFRGGGRTILSPRWQNLIRDFRRLRDLIG